MKLLFITADAIENTVSLSVIASLSYLLWRCSDKVYIFATKSRARKHEWLYGTRVSNVTHFFAYTHVAEILCVRTFSAHLNTHIRKIMSE